MACDYCFEHPRRFRQAMTEEVARMALDMLAQNAQKNGTRRINVTFFGGEPLLNWPVTKFILEYMVRLKGSKRVDGIGGTLITNGTLLKDEWLDYFKKNAKRNGLNIQLSIDGTQRVHDKHRVFPNGKGTYEAIMKNVPRWLELGENVVHVHSVFNLDTIKYMYESYLSFREMGFRDIWFLPIPYLPYSSQNVEEYEEQLTKIKDDIVREYRETRNPDLKQGYAPLDRGWKNPCGFSKPCGAGVNYVSVTASGDIYPCHHFYYQDPEHHTKIGDVYTGVDEQRRLIYVEYDHSDLSCGLNKECENFNCYRCISDNYEMSGSIFTNPMGMRCAISSVERRLMKSFTEELETIDQGEKNEHP